MKKYLLLRLVLLFSALTTYSSESEKEVSHNETPQAQPTKPGFFSKKIAPYVPSKLADLTAVELTAIPVTAISLAITYYAHSGENSIGWAVRNIKFGQTIATSKWRYLLPTGIGLTYGAKIAKIRGLF